MTKCAICRQPFEPRSAVHRYCSDMCRVKAGHERSREWQQANAKDRRVYNKKWMAAKRRDAGYVERELARQRELRRLGKDE